MTTIRPKFDVKQWLRESVGENQHSPLKVDPFELKQAERSIRQELSAETNPQRRAGLLEAFRASVASSDFARLAGPKVSGSFNKLLSGEAAPLLYQGGKSLDSESSIRAALLDILAGSGDSIDQYPLDYSRDLAASVKPSETKLALEQVEQTLGELAGAMKRLAPETANREVDGTSSKSGNADRLAILQLTAARLREPAAAKAMDAVATLRERPFTYATFADVGVSRSTFETLRAAADAAVGSKRRTAGSDINVLWQATRSRMGGSVDSHSPDKGFARIQFAGDDDAKAFTKAVGDLEKKLTGRTSTEQLWQ